MDASQAVVDTTIALEESRRELEELGLNAYEARVLLALLQLGTATATELARHSRVPRTSMYSVTASLCERGLARPSASVGAAAWASFGWEAVVERLMEAHEGERLRGRRRIEHLRETLGAALPTAPAALSYVHVLDNVYALIRLYDRLLGQAQGEVLVLNRGPYVGDLTPSPAVLAMLARGVPTRAIYIAAELEGAGGLAVRALAQIYVEAGAVIRVAERLPISLAVFDRTEALISLEDAGIGIPGYPTPLHVDHGGFAAAQADLFETYWATAVLFRASGAVVRDASPARTRRPGGRR